MTNLHGNNNEELRCLNKNEGREKAILKTILVLLLAITWQSKAIAETDNGFKCPEFEPTDYSTIKKDSILQDYCATIGQWAGYMHTSLQANKQALEFKDSGYNAAAGEAIKKALLYLETAKCVKKLSDDDIAALTERFGIIEKSGEIGGVLIDTESGKEIRCVDSPWEQ